jgi:hypothetical protein
MATRIFDAQLGQALQALQETVQYHVHENIAKVVT